MAYTYGTSAVKILNIDSIVLNGTITITGSALKDGVSFVDAQNSEIKTADGNSQSTSEKTTISADAIGLTSTVMGSIKALHSSTVALVIEFAGSADKLTTSGILSVLRNVKGNDVPFLNISMEQSDYDVDTVSVWS